MVLDMIWPRKRPQLPHSEGVPEQRGLHKAAHFVMKTSEGNVIENRSQMATMNRNYHILEERGVELVLPA